jgi:hypothetical protein
MKSLVAECPRCNGKFANATFCSSCGSKLVPNNESPDSPPHEPIKWGEKSRGKIWILSTLIVVAVAVGIFLVAGIAAGVSPTKSSNQATLASQTPKAKDPDLIFKIAEAAISNANDALAKSSSAVGLDFEKDELATAVAGLQSTLATGDLQQIEADARRLERKAAALLVSLRNANIGAGGGSSVDIAPEPAQKKYSFARPDVEDFVRQTLYERTEYYFLTGFPENMIGVPGDTFTGMACPQDYVAPDSSGWLTLAGRGPFRCDAAGGGWAFEVRVMANGDLEFLGDSIRNLR